MIRMLIADDHDVVRSGLRHIIEAQPNWQVVAEAGDGKEAVQKALETKPDVAVIDYSLPILNGAEATRQIRAALPQTEVLIFTMHDNETSSGSYLRSARAVTFSRPTRGTTSSPLSRLLRLTNRSSPLKSPRRSWIPTFHIPHGSGRL